MPLIIEWELIYCYRDTKDTDGEARAASGLGEVYLQMGEFDKAMQYHQMAYDISETHEDMDGKVILFLRCYFLKLIKMNTLFFTKFLQNSNEDFDNTGIRPLCRERANNR